MSAPEPPAPRRARPSARAARQKERAAPPAAPPYLTRAIPPYELLSEEGLEQVERHADQLLEEIGLEIRGDLEAVRLWRAAGARIGGDWRVHVPRGLAREIVRRSAPREFTQHARNPARSVPIGGNHTVFAPAYGPPFVSDLDGGRRYGTLADFCNFVKLTYASPWLHHSGGTVCEPVDVPVNKRHLDMVYAHIRYSDKPFMGSVTSASRAADSIEMCRLLFGADFVESHCVILGNVNVNSPLVLDGEASRVIRTYAAANQAPVCVPFILGGAMGPVTTAGGLAQCFAEATFCVALGQLERPGSPAILGNFLSSMSLRSGAPTFGTPEPARPSARSGRAGTTWARLIPSRTTRARSTTSSLPTTTPSSSGAPKGGAISCSVPTAAGRACSRLTSRRRSMRPGRRP
jgi:trimethylamine---corrinoid protein Co-methyltransferase